MSQVKDIAKENKKTIWLVLLLLLGFFIYGSFSNNYHKAKIKELKKEIAVVQDQFEEAVEEKERFRDSSMAYEFLAEQARNRADAFKAKAAKERKAKEEALATLRNLPKDVIDTFFITRYAQVSKSDISLEIDKNIGNEIIIELIEKDHLVGELATAETLNNTLSTQVKSLESSLMFSKVALVRADSVIAFKSKQFEMQQQASDFLKQDLKTAKNKAFWNKWKGVGVGIAAGVVVGLLVK
jgi:septum formation topological specificity factor MinE